MGVGSCSFRNCDVNRKHHPNMHFFKFPIKEEERFKKWIKFSDAEHILNLKPVTQLNHGVCGRHFRDEAFLNYKKNRLLPNEIPTITRISETRALDYEDLNEDGTPKLIKLKKTTLPHLIGPPGFVCPLDLPPDYEPASTSSTTPVSSVRKRSLDQESDGPDKKKKCHKMEEPESQVLNESIDDVKIEAEIKGENSYEILKLKHIKVINMYNDLLVSHNELQMQRDKLQLEVNESKTTTAAAPPAPPAAPAQQLTKSQLFHGIKRYLRPSMTTLVRMEMFGSSEREWKPDERLVSMDLMRLGGNVYKFFLDEWRVRMPSFREVHSWLSNAANNKGNHDEEVEDL